MFCFPGVIAGEEIGEGAAGADDAGAAAGEGARSEVAGREQDLERVSESV